MNGINQRLDIAGVKAKYSNNREYANAIGVLEKIKNFTKLN